MGSTRSAPSYPSDQRIYYDPKAPYDSGSGGGTVSHRPTIHGVAYGLGFVEFHGSTLPGARISLSLFGGAQSREFATTTADESGNWQVTVYSVPQQREFWVVANATPTDPTIQVYPSNVVRVEIPAGTDQGYEINSHGLSVLGGGGWVPGIAAARRSDGVWVYGVLRRVVSQ